MHPDFARQGVGRRIILACEVAARAEGFDRLELAATLPGQPLYAALGYHVTERVEIGFPDGITLPIVRMAKKSVS